MNATTKVAVRLMVGILAFIGFLGFMLVLLIRTNNLAEDNRRQTNAIEESRTVNQIGSCEQDRIRIKQHNDLAVATKAIQTELNALLALTTTVPEGTVLTADQQARLEAFVALAAEQRKIVEAALATTIVEDRDCSKPGIADYLSKLD